MKKVEVTFPLFEDSTMEVGKKYGMVQPNESSAKAVRSLFFIDCTGMVRVLIYCPLSQGSNIAELKRVLIAIQTGDAYAIATHAECQLNDDVIVPISCSCSVAKDRMKTKEVGASCYDCFFCTQQLSLEQVNIPPKV